MLALGGLIDIRQAIAPLDLQTARDGDYISLKHATGVLVVVHKGIGTDGDDQTISFDQGTDVAFGTNKTLAVIKEYWEKEGTLTAVGTWTRVAQTAAATVAPGDPSAQSQAVYVFDIKADQLDVDGGYDCLRVSTDGAGNNAQLGCMLYILYGLRYQRSPADALSAIAD